MAGKAAAGLLALLVLLPLLYLMYRLLRIAAATHPSAKADQVYRAALYRFHMAGIERENETPLDYARTKVDPSFQTGFEEFMGMYLRLKYGGGGVQPGDKERIDAFARKAGPSIRNKKGYLRTALNYFNLLQAYRYFQEPQPTDHETFAL